MQYLGGRIENMLSALAAWLVDYSLTKGADALSAATFAPRELDTLLTGAIERWASTLPVEHALRPEALFQPAAGGSGEGEAAAHLRERLKNGSVPTAEEWHAALLERWSAVRDASGEDELQPFFRLERQVVEDSLRDLAERLVSAAVQNEKLFRASVSQALRNIETNTRTDTAAGVTIALRDVRLPSYDPAAMIEFVIHNRSTGTLLVSDLSVEVLDCAEIADIRTVTAGAPVQHIELRAHVEPTPGRVELTPQQFVYAPGATDFFRLRLSATPGWHYHLRLSGKQAVVPDFVESIVYSAEFWLYSPGIV
jgi:hypothetical protein